MKKLLLTSAVLVGMGASQAFATDTWDATVNLDVDPFCQVADTAAITVANDTGGSATIAAADAANALSDTTPNVLDDANYSQDITTTILLDDDTFCNATHNFVFKSRFGGYAIQDATTLSSDPTDDFRTKLNHGAVTITGWDSAVTGLSTAAFVAAADVNDYNAAAVVWSAIDGTAGNGAVIASPTGTPVAAFRNNATNGGDTLASDGLQIALTYDSPASPDPLLAGTYTDQFYVELTPNP